MPYWEYNNSILSEQHYCCTLFFGYEFADSPYEEECFKIRTHINKAV